MQSGPWTLRVLEAMPPNAYWDLHPPLRVEICRMRGLLKTLEQAKAEAQRAKGKEEAKEEPIMTKAGEPGREEISCLVM